MVASRWSLKVAGNASNRVTYSQTILFMVFDSQGVIFGTEVPGTNPLYDSHFAWKTSSPSVTRPSEGGGRCAPFGGGATVAAVEGRRRRDWVGGRRDLGNFFFGFDHTLGSNSVVIESG